MSEEQARYPLAYDSAGNPIELPAEAVAWRVRRGGGRRGRPRNVFDRETGRQLEIPLGATLDDMIEADCKPDRYLLYPVDRHGHVIPSIVAVTEVPEYTDDEEDEGKRQKTGDGSMKRELLRAVLEMATTMCRTVEATTSGYGPVRPSQPPLVERNADEAPTADEGLKGADMAQILGIANRVIEMMSGGLAKPPGSDGTSGADGVA